MMLTGGCGVVVLVLVVLGCALPDSTAPEPDSSS